MEGIIRAPRHPVLTLTGSFYLVCAAIEPMHGLCSGSMLAFAGFAGVEHLTFHAFSSITRYDRIRQKYRK